MRHNFRLPHEDPIAAWFQLGARDEKTLIIKIHRKALDMLKGYNLASAPLVTDFLRSDVFQDKKIGQTTGKAAGQQTEPMVFIEPSQPKWGFGEILCEIPSDRPQWHVYECVLPVLYDKKKPNVYGDANAVRSTLSVLFAALYGFNGDTGHDTPQLIVPNHICVRNEMHGASFSAVLTPAAIKWLSKQGDHTRLSAMEELMMATDSYLWHDSHGSSRLDFRVWCRQPKWINIGIPGNACGFDPEDYSLSEPERGYELVPHNMDSGLQQLIMLMGFAKLHDLMLESA